jgi:hypothetical protein
MPKYDPAEFEDIDARLIFLARTIKEAERVEQILNDQGIDFTVQLEFYLAGILFTRERAGIGFYVYADQAESCRELLRRNFKAGIVDEPPE